jgi:hypothetical protein
MADLTIVTRRVMNSPVLDLNGEVDSYNAPKLREKMVALIDEGNSDVILNLTDVDYIDSTGLGALVGADYLPQPRHPQGVSDYQSGQGVHHLRQRGKRVRREVVIPERAARQSVCRAGTFRACKKKSRASVV